MEPNFYCVCSMHSAHHSVFPRFMGYRPNKKVQNELWHSVEISFSLRSSVLRFSFFHSISVHDEWNDGEWQATLHCFVQPPPTNNTFLQSHLLYALYSISDFSLQNSLLIYSLYSIYQAIFYLLFFSFYFIHEDELFQGVVRYPSNNVSFHLNLFSYSPRWLIVLDSWVWIITYFVEAPQCLCLRVSSHQIPRESRMNDDKKRQQQQQQRH